MRASRVVSRRTRRTFETRRETTRDATPPFVGSRVLLSTRAPLPRVVVDRPTDRPTATTSGPSGPYVYCSYFVYESMTQNNVHEHENDGSMRTEGNTPHRAAPTRVDPTVDAGRRGTSTRGDDEEAVRRGRASTRSSFVSFVVMVGTWCDACARAVATETNESNGFTCCTACGKILDERAAFSGEATFTKNARGRYPMDSTWGTRRRPGGDSSDEGVDACTRRRWTRRREDAVPRTTEIKQVADRLGVRPREDMVDAAHRLYKLAVQRNFTRGRRIDKWRGRVRTLGVDKSRGRKTC